MRWKHAIRPRWVALGLVVLAALAYVRALDFEPVWDDPYLVTSNPFLREWRHVEALLSNDLWTTTSLGEKSSFYRPLPMLSYLVNGKIGGYSAASFRAGNVLLHGINGALLLVLLRRPGARRVEGSVLASSLMATWFVLAAVHVETVAWLSARFDLLGTALLLGALLVRRNDHLAARGASALLLVAAILCKETFVAGVGVVIVHELIFFSRRWRGHATEIAVGSLGLLGYFAMRSWAEVPSASMLRDTGFAKLVTSYAGLLATFPALLVAPTSLDPFRRYEPMGAEATSLVWFLAAAILGLLVVRWRAKPGRWTHRALLFGTAVTLGSFVPTSLTGPNLGMVGDRYAYLPSIGLLFVAAGLFDGAWVHVEKRLAHGRALLVGGLATLLIVQLATMQARLDDWRTAHSLYSASVQRDPHNPNALYRLGHLEAKAGHLHAAADLLGRALVGQPDDWRTLNALCFVELNTNRLEYATRRCAGAVRTNPDNPRAWINLSSVHIRRQRWGACVETATQALARLRPTIKVADILAQRAACSHKLGRLKQARADVGRALAINPRHPVAKRLLLSL